MIWIDKRERPGGYLCRYQVKLAINMRHSRKGNEMICIFDGECRNVNVWIR